MCCRLLFPFSGSGYLKFKPHTSSTRSPPPNTTLPNANDSKYTSSVQISRFSSNLTFLCSDILHSKGNLNLINPKLNSTILCPPKYSSILFYLFGKWHYLFYSVDQAWKVIENITLL